MNIEAKELSKIYGSGESRVVALDNVNLEIASNDFISIMGPSGSGKSTLLHLLSGLDKPTSLREIQIHLEQDFTEGDWKQPGLWQMRLEVEGLLQEAIRQTEAVYECEELGKEV